MIIEKRQKYMSEKGNKQKYLWDYYMGDKSIIPVYKRTPIDSMKEKSHTNAHVDFFGDIIDVKQGYIGEKIDIYYNSDDNTKDLVKQWLKSSNMATMNSQTVEYSSVEGISHRLIYTVDGEFKQMNLHGWQVIYEGNPLQPDLAYYFFEEDGSDYCNIYDDTMAYTYMLVERNNKKEYMYVSEKEHNFHRVPVIPFLNTSNMESNCDKSVELMDLYDEVISDSVGEIKDLRRVLLKIKGVDDIYTEKDLAGNPLPITQSIKQSSTILFGTSPDGKTSGDAEYMTNNLDDAAITSTLNRLRSLIYETSGSVDLKELSTAERVFSIKASLLRLENNAKTTENYMKMGLYIILDCWSYLMKEIKNIIIDVDKFDIHIGRKIPMDEAGVADIFMKLSTILSVEDAARIAGFDNPKELAERANSKNNL